MDNEALRADLLRAEHAKQLADNPLLAEILDGMVGQIESAWMNAETDEQANEIRKVALAANKVRSAINAAIKRGGVARAEIEQANR